MFFYLFLFSLSINPPDSIFSGHIRTEQELQFVDYDSIQLDLEADGRIDTTISFETSVTGTRTFRSYWKSLVKVTNSNFHNCFAFGVALTFGSGGAIYTQQSCLYILKSSFNSNQAATGGSIACVNSRSVIEQAAFTFDIAYQRAGSFYSISSDQLSEVDSDDAIVFPINEISMIDSSFFMCQSNELYGAAYIYGSTNTYLHNVRFEKCTAKAPCGAIAISESTAFIDGCKFLGNACNVLPDIPNEMNAFKSKMINRQKGIPSGGGAIIFSCVDHSKQLTSQNCCFNGNIANYPNLNTFNGAPSIGNDILFQGDAKWRSFQDIFSTNSDNAIAVDTVKTSSVTIDQWGTTFHTVDGVCVTEKDVLDYPINSYPSTSNVEETSISYAQISYDDNTQINQKPDPATKFPDTPVIIGYVSYTLHPHSPEIPFPTPAETQMQTPIETPVSTQGTTPFLTAIETPFETASKTAFETPFQTNYITPFETVFQTAGETPFNTPFHTEFETPFETAFETAFETPFITAIQTEKETPYLTEKETPYLTEMETPINTAIETPYTTPAISDLIPRTAIETAVETVVETPFSTALETAFETPFETAFETAHETPFETAFDTAVGTAFETPFSTAIQTPYLTEYETPFTTALQTAFETPFTTPESSALIPRTAAETAKETAIETPFSTAYQTAFETPFETAFETAKETPFETAFQTAFETAFQTPFETAFETAFQTAAETPFNTVFETAFSTAHQTPFETAFSTPFNTAFETAIETPFSTAHDTPFETVFSTAHNTPFETVFTTPFLTAVETPFETVFRTPEITIDAPVIVPTPNETVQTTPAKELNVDPSTDTKKNFNIWPIVAGVIAAIVLVAAILAFFMLKKKEDKDDVGSDTIEISEHEGTVLTDFDDIPITTENPLWGANMMNEGDPDPFNNDFDEDAPIVPQNDKDALFFV